MLELLCKTSENSFWSKTKNFVDFLFITLVIKLEQRFHTFKMFLENTLLAQKNTRHAEIGV